MFLRKPAWLGWDECHVGFGVFVETIMTFGSRRSCRFWRFCGNQHDVMTIPTFPLPDMIPTLSFSWLFHHFLFLSWFQPSAFHDYSTISSSCHDSNPQLFMFISQFSKPVMIPSTSFSCLPHNFLFLSWFQAPAFHDYSTISSSCHDSKHQLFMTIPPFPLPVMIPTLSFSWLFHNFLFLSWFQPSAFHDYSTTSSSCHDSNPQLFMTIPQLPLPVMIPTLSFSWLFHNFLFLSWFQSSAFHFISQLSKPVMTSSSNKYSK